MAPVATRTRLEVRFEVCPSTGLAPQRARARLEDVSTEMEDLAAEIEFSQLTGRGGREDRELLAALRAEEAELKETLRGGGGSGGADSIDSNDEILGVHLANFSMWDQWSDEADWCSDFWCELSDRRGVCPRRASRPLSDAEQCMAW